MGARFATVANSGAVSWTTQGDLVASQAALNPVPNHTRQLKRDDLAGSATQLMTQEALSRQRAEELIPRGNKPATLFDFIEDATAPFALTILIFLVISTFEMIQRKLCLSDIE